MVIKVKFDIEPLIDKNELCDFHVSHHIAPDYFKARYVGNSRIDGYPMFDVLTKSSYPVQSYHLLYKGLQFKMESCELIRPLEDYYDSTSAYHNRRNELLDIAMSVFDITDSDLNDEVKYREKLRNIKLSDLLN